MPLKTASPSIESRDTGNWGTALAGIRAARLGRCLVVAVAVVGGISGCAWTVRPAAADSEALAPSEATHAARTLTQVSIPDECHPEPAPAASQYIVGYGSLMQDESRKRTSPNAGPAHPVELSGFRRGWFAKGGSIGPGTTYLGVVPDPRSSLNAVVYRIDASELKATDQREASYCRWKVPVGDLKAMDPAAPPLAGGESWIYVNTPDEIAVPSAGFPIVQSYVDIFLSGCLEQEERFKLPGFARECLLTTDNWSQHWVNDRIYPRRPFIYQPKSGSIDRLLSQQLPDFFSRIRIE